MITTRIKQFLYPFYIYPKISWLRKKKTRQLFSYYQAKAKAGELISYTTTGLKLFSNMEEDGIILWLIALLNIRRGIFLDIGSHDCINSNCANLVFNFNWEGTFIDSDKKLLKIGERTYKLFSKTIRQKLRFVANFLTPENVNEIVGRHAINNEIDFMSIDIDGNDYFIWKALTCVRPKIVMIENKVEYGHHEISIPANSYFLQSEWGASPVSVTKLAEKKGYVLVAANKKGFNTFYLREDLINGTIEPLKIEDILKDPEVSRDFYDDAVMNAIRDKLEPFRKTNTF